MYVYNCCGVNVSKFSAVLSFYESLTSHFGNCDIFNCFCGQANFTNRTTVESADHKQFARYATMEAATHRNKTTLLSQ